MDSYWLQMVIISTILIAFIAVASKVFPWLLQQYRIFKNLREQWKGPPSHWLFGHAAVLKQNKQDPMAASGYFMEQQKNYSYGFAIYIGPRPLLRIYHPAVIKEILLASASDAPKSSMMKTIFGPWLGKGLLILNGKEWSRQRRLLTYSFHFDILKSYLYHMNSCTDTLQEKWESQLKDKEETRVEIFSDASLMTLDAILQSLVSYKSNCQINREKNAYISAIYAMSELIPKRGRNRNPLRSLFNFIYLRTEDGRKFLKKCEIAHEFSYSFIKKRKEENLKGTKNSNRKLDFLDTLLQAKDSDGTGFTDYEIRSQLDTFLFGGHDTTACAISWLLYHLSLHPEIQERCAVEADAVLGDKMDVEWADLSSFPFLTRCIKESLRLCPSAPSIGRVLNKDIHVEGKTILKGTSVSIAIQGMHTHEKFWKNSDKFDPDRFTLERAAEQVQHSYIPFSAGPRNCIGQSFAMNEIKVVAAKLLRKFRFNLDTKHKIIPCHEVVYRTKTGLYLYVEKRS